MGALTDALHSVNFVVQRSSLEPDRRVQRPGAPDIRGTLYGKINAIIYKYNQKKKPSVVSRVYRDRGARTLCCLYSPTSWGENRLGELSKIVRIYSCQCNLWFYFNIENCLLLALYTYVISRPDKQVSDKHWLLLEHEVVRFLNKLITQGWSSPSNRSGVACLCNREVVKVLVRTLHQEWLNVRRLTVLLPSPNQNKSVLFLREAIMVLHSLYQKDKSFSEHCLEVFHQYDQAVPGVRALFRKFNTMNENEEFALDELCPPEVETEDENMDCT
ncbi:unnamed protein product [Ranitomeya imitator]|uniref:Uncharacterized protein n=1 Tax=Ranitomeya imitator TaxID=111125 RepID=A0ABN9L5Q2_9NEOB|nr:unnamed protein product [Ranitomeya imitator]